jgi:hypothetical protein
MTGGFDGGEGSESRSVAMMKMHIKELMEKLAKAEEDKQKIADEAYRSFFSSLFKNYHPIPRLPDGIFSSERSQFEKIVVGLAIEDIAIFYDPLVYLRPFGIFYGHLVYLTSAFWGRCYDHNFLQFFPIFGKKLAFFLNTNIMIKLFQNFALFSVKNENFFAKFFGENIFKIITSVPGCASLSKTAIVCRRCQILKHESDAKLESAAVSQSKQANLVERLQVKTKLS